MTHPPVAAGITSSTYPPTAVVSAHRFLGRATSVSAPATSATALRRPLPAPGGSTRGHLRPRRGAARAGAKAAEPTSGCTTSSASGTSTPLSSSWSPCGTPSAPPWALFGWPRSNPKRGSIQAGNKWIPLLRGLILSYL
jgi:hypothetical protein